MYRIIEKRGSGKTSNLMMTAKMNDAKFVCSNPYAMGEKSHSYGITGIDFVSYEDVINGNVVCERVVIDEIEEFVKYIITNNKLVGYSLTNED